MPSHQEQAMFHIWPLVNEWAHVRQGMAFNLPLFAMSPVSDLTVAELPAPAGADNCVYRFEVMSAENHIWFTAASTDTMM